MGASALEFCGDVYMFVGFKAALEAGHDLEHMQRLIVRGARAAVFADSRTELSKSQTAAVFRIVKFKRQLFRRLARQMQHHGSAGNSWGQVPTTCPLSRRLLIMGRCAFQTSNDEIEPMAPH